jgi:hypothetical protein
MSVAIDGRPCLSSVEAGARLQTHPASLARKARAGLLQAHKLQGRFYFVESEIEALASCTQKETAQN